MNNEKCLSLDITAHAVKESSTKVEGLTLDWGSEMPRSRVGRKKTFLEERQRVQRPGGSYKIGKAKGTQGKPVCLESGGSRGARIQ